ncbi:MAG TPA: XRE family transcriptional regulator [Draconibacterium sp.]|jgi:quercetin dioxygenase-like cupin family protein/DNA-binding XRE family transcriptional regulator|nr:XRE family transcriptional regulator [Draconibacterium sp.]
MKTKNSLGSKIKDYREFRQISRTELALKANLDENQLECIEEKGIVPSLGHLIKITRALGVRIGTFLDDQDQIGPVIVRAGTEKSSMSFSTKSESTREHLSFYSLAQDKSGRHMEPFMIDIEPSAHSDYKLSSHEGEEFIYVLKGKVEINYGKELYLLNEGDSIYLDSIVAHNVHAAANQKAKILGVVYYPL